MAEWAQQESERGPEQAKAPETTPEDETQLDCVESVCGCR